MERIEFMDMQFEEISIESFGEVKGWFKAYQEIMEQYSIPWVGVLSLNSVGFAWDMVLPKDYYKTMEDLFIRGILAYGESCDLAYEQYCRVLDYESCIDVLPANDTFIVKITYLLKDGNIYRRVLHG